MAFIHYMQCFKIIDFCLIKKEFFEKGILKLVKYRPVVTHGFINSLEPNIILNQAFGSP